MHRNGAVFGITNLEIHDEEKGKKTDHKRIKAQRTI